MKGPTRRSVDLRLYLVMDPSVTIHDDLERLIRDAVEGGVTLVQVREKNCSNEDFLRLAQKAARLLGELGVPLIVNDRVDVALEVGAQGVHVGQSDLHWSEARRLMGPRALIGVSVENLHQARALENADIDYLGVSSVFPTRTKTDVAGLWGLEGLSILRGQTEHALVGIGGIDASNVSDVIQAGADGAAIVSAICSAAQPLSSATTIRSLIDTANAQRSKGAGK